MNQASYSFIELSKKSQEKAILDYQNGWRETHPNDSLSDGDVVSILTTDLKCDRYKSDGSLTVD
jgi:hypothetical protein